MNPSTRYTILLIAGIANICVGVYAFALVITQIILGLEALWVILLGLITSLAGLFLIARTLPTLLRMQQGEQAPVLLDERTHHILFRAGFSAFAFFTTILIIVIGIIMALPKLGYILTGNELTIAILGIWITGILIFTLSLAYHSRT